MTTGWELGAVLTSAELDGLAPAGDWARWVEAGRAPATHSVDGAGFAINEVDDLTQLRHLGADVVMVTAEWARLEPRHGHHDPAALEALEHRLRTARELGFTVWLCLVDGTLPGWFADDEGGFGDERGRTLVWPRHIDWIGERLGDMVDGWVPQREPLLWALRRNLLGSAPPGRSDPVKAAEAVQAAILTDAEAWRLLAGTAPVATYQTVRPILAARAERSGQDDVKAQAHAANIERLLWHPWVAALNEGRLVAGGLPEREVPELRGAFDRIVMELRPPVVIGPEGQWRTRRPDLGPMLDTLYRAVDEMGERELVVAGSLAGVVDDGRNRADHQLQLMEAAADAGRSSRLVGWWQSSIIDGYGLTHSFAPHPGLINRDRSEDPAAAIYRSQAAD